jgi:hypothetical protein
MSDDLKRDLKLASTTQDIRIDPDEINSESKTQAALTLKKATIVPKLVRSEKPKVLASTALTEAPAIKTDIPDVQVMAPAPTPTASAPEAPPLARPSTIPVSNSGPGASNGGSGIFGGILGAVIRGGVVGDDDHCDPRTAPRGGRRPTSTDVYGGIGGIFGGGTGVAGGIGSRGRP